jgi:hypothetical protein
VSSSVVLVSTQPVFVALLSGVFLGERRRAAVARASSWPWRARCHRAGRLRLGATHCSATDSPSAAACLRVDLLRDRPAVAPGLDLWWYVGIIYGIAALVLIIAAVAAPGVG